MPDLRAVPACLLFINGIKEKLSGENNKGCDYRDRQVHSWKGRRAFFLVLPWLGLYAATPGIELVAAEAYRGLEIMLGIFESAKQGCMLKFPLEI